MRRNSTDLALTEAVDRKRGGKPDLASIASIIRQLPGSGVAKGG